MLFLKEKHGHNCLSLETMKNRIRLVCGIKIIRELGEWSGLKKTEEFLNVKENRENHSMIWWMFMTVAMESAIFMGKNYQNKS